MQFNKNIFRRLYNIACFIPEITAQDNWEQQDGFTLSMDFEQEDQLSNIKAKNQLQLPLHIKVVEVKLFLLCIRAYENLQNVFSEFENSFPGPESYIENPNLFYAYIVSQNELSEQLIEEKSLGMFRGVRNCVRFYCNFADSYGIYRCFKSILPTLEKLKFLSELRNHLYSNMRFAIRFNGDLMAALFDLSTHLDCYNQCADGSPERENILQSLITAYGEIWYHFHSIAILPSIYKPNEKKRRDAISKTKWNNNSCNRQQVEAHLKIIQANAAKSSIRQACINYFAEHKDELEMLNIKSYRTLQNRLLSKSPNHLRKEFNDSICIAPTYLWTFESSINKIWDNTK